VRSVAVCTTDTHKIENQVTGALFRDLHQRAIDTLMGCWRSELNDSDDEGGEKLSLSKPSRQHR
jgi:hypothetical protein